MSIKLPESKNNLITFIGIVLAIAGFSVFWVMLLLTQTGLLGHGQYQGLVLYILLPVPVVIGLLLIPVGMYRYNKRKKAGEAVQGRSYPVFDFNRPRHRNAALIFVFGTMFLGVFMIFAGYNGYHYSESVSFCGTLCHEVMEPEYVTYKHSPHARVACVTCHVGAGAGWYAKSKLSGLYQVYAVLADVYPRPIETPIKNLRPAREVCEQCHWPGKLFPARERRFYHFITDEDNKPYHTSMMVEIGGEGPGEEKPGSHWHVRSNVKIEYIATDTHREVIPWVRLTYKDTGKQVVYNSTEEPIEAEDIKNHEIRTMDCIDCHNRPSHSYQTTLRALNNAMYAGDISPELPEIKPTATELLSAEYADKDSAMQVIEQGIKDYYAENYSEIAGNKPAIVNKAAAAVREIYKNNYFPKMNARWEVYPVNLGHLEFPGCFRCHNGKHEAADGTKIVHSCNACHKILAQGDQHVLFRSEGMEFKHPIDIDEEWRETPCNECHAPDN